MAAPIENEIFKFVAVRPAQRLPDAQVQQNFLHDPRLTKPDGPRFLATMGRQLGTPDAAAARLATLDTSSLAPFVAALPTLSAFYTQTNAEDPPMDAREALKQAGLSSHAPDPQQVQLAWDALYAASVAGSNAGPQLERFIAVLRVLHFAESLAAETHPARDVALKALKARPILPAAFYDAWLAAQQAPVTPAEPAPTPPDPRSAGLRALAEDLTKTNRLLSQLDNAPVVAVPVVQQASATVPEGEMSRSEFRLHSQPTIRTALGASLSRLDVSHLAKLNIAETTPVRSAAQTLRTHLVDLNAQAFPLANDTEFQGILRSLTAPLLARTPQIGDRVGIGIGNMDPDNEFAPDVDMTGRITPLGIGDLKVVKQTLLAYVAGEVAHIENVLKGESKERTHRNLERTETTLFTSDEETRDIERDTQTTDRFELKRETDQSIKEDMSVKAGLTVTAAYGPVVATATGDFAYATSKQDSQKSSSNFARELIDRSVSKVQTKTKTERTTKTLNEVEEIDKHGFVNTDAGAANITGVYRWVDKRYRAQIYNYGIRMLLEFIVPEPAAFFRAAQLRPPTLPGNLHAPPPFVNLAGQTLTAADITEHTYLYYAGLFNAAGVTPPPAAETRVGVSVVKEGLEPGKFIGMRADNAFVIADGYTLESYSASVSLIWRNHPQFTLLIGGDKYEITATPGFPEGASEMTTAQENKGLPVLLQTGFSGTVPVSMAGFDINAFAVNIDALCKLTTEAKEKWILQTFDKIYTAYQSLQTAYDQKVTQAQSEQQVVIQGQNPVMNRAVEKTELKKLCITMMTGQHFDQFKAMTDPPDKPLTYPEVDLLQALAEGRIFQFFEQAFEWEQMTYLFYPYFWGRKKNWVDIITNHSDPDPLFVQFLTAGAARVVVPVPIAYADAVKYLLTTKGALKDKVWGGGERPVIDDPNGLYVSIADELRNQTDDLSGAKPEGDSWEFTLPTTLVWLQPDAALPTFP